MNNWSSENYAMQHAMGNMGMMNVISSGGPALLPTPVCVMPDIPPMTKPPPEPTQLLNQPTDTMNQVLDDDAMVIENDSTNDSLSSPNTQNRNTSDRAGSYYKRDRDRGRRSRSRDNDNSRSDRNDRRTRWNDRKTDGNQRERRTKWGDRDVTSTGLPGGMNVTGNMILPPTLPAYHSMVPPPNMIGNMQGNIVMPPPMGPGQGLVPQMALMNNILPNVMEPNMMIMNQQQMMPMLGNHTIYMNTGVILPPLPGVQTPQRREKPKGCRTIFVGGLPHDVTTATLKEMFERFGPIDSIKSPKVSTFYVRFENHDSLEQAFYFSGHRFKYHSQSDNEATTLLIDYALNRVDQIEYDKQQRNREVTPPRVEHFSPSTLSSLSERIKNEEEFANVAAILANWLERGECNKKNANSFYSLVQVSNNQIRRLFNEKMQLDDEHHAMKTTFREKYAHLLLQFEQVAKVLSAAKHQRVSDHFTKQQRRNIEMWLKMTEDVENIREEFHATFDEDDTEKGNRNVISLEKFEELKLENENLSYELQGYKNEAHMAKDDAERKFETFRAHFIAQQALQNKQQGFSLPITPSSLPKTDDSLPSAPVPPSEAKLISILTAFLMVHPLGASIDYLTSYVKSLIPNASQANVRAILVKYEDVFQCKTTGVGASIDRRWTFATFDVIKSAM